MKTRIVFYCSLVLLSGCIMFTAVPPGEFSYSGLNVTATAPLRFLQAYSGSSCGVAGSAGGVGAAICPELATAATPLRTAH